MCDPEVMRYSEGVLDHQEAHEWLKNRIASPDEQTWVLVTRNGNRIAGWCALCHFPDLNGVPETELGYRLAREFWGRGLATEAAAAVRDHARDRLGLRRLVSLIDPGNRASTRVAEKLGMVHEADLMLPGYSHPDRLYAVEFSSPAPV